MRELDFVDLTEHPDFLTLCGLTEAHFVQGICHLLKTAFDANTVFVASLRLVESDYFFVEACSERDNELKTKHFFASSTPCDEVITNRKPVHISSRVCEIYPNAEILKELGSEAYIGFPLQRPDGTMTGALVLDWSEEIAASSLQMVIETITPYLGRVVAELERKTLAHIIPALINPIDPLPQDDRTKTFRDIARQAAEITNVNTIAIVHRAYDRAKEFQILAMTSLSSNTDGMENLIVDYFGIPFVNMLTNDIYLETSGVVARYPDSPLLKKFDVESYLGFGFRNSSGETIGHIAFLHNHPMRESVKDCDIIRVIASRAGQELQRYALELEREAIHKALRVRTKLESLGTMSGTIAHNFNNQLTAMIGHTELAALELDPNHPAQEHLEVAEQVMWRARDVVAEIMDFAGNDKGAPLEEVALGEMIASINSEFTPRLNGKSRIITEIAPNIPSIQSRRIQVFQILTNLIANGLDALSSEESQDLVVSIDTTELSDFNREKCLTGQCAALPERCVRLTLKDLGRGMDAETAERIFDPYFSTKGVSRGLGLSSVLGVAKSLKIGLTCESELGVGTTFQLFFAPLDAAALAEADAAEPQAAANRKKQKTALVVDDDKTVNAFISKQISLWGWHVVSANSGEEALQIANSSDQFDIAIVDLVMAGMNGVETLERLWEIIPALPAVIVSGYSHDSLLDGLTGDKSIQFLVKPFGSELLKNAIDKAQAGTVVSSGTKKARA